MSVDIESLIVAAGDNPREYVTTQDFTGSVSFLAREARSLELRVGYDPVPENPHRGEVWGNERPNRFSRTQKRGLGHASQWYVELPEVDIV